MHIDLPAVVQRDLDFVEPFLVADLGAGDPAATGVLQCSGAGPIERLAGDRRLGVVPATGGGDPGGCADEPDGSAALPINFAFRSTMPTPLAMGW